MKKYGIVSTANSKDLDKTSKHAKPKENKDLDEINLRDKVANINLKSQK